MFYSDLPPTLKEYINENSAFLKKIGVKVFSVIQIDGHRFNASEFWLSMGKAYRGEEPELKTVDSEAFIKIKVEINEVRYCIRGEQISEKWKRLVNPDLILAHPEAEEIRQILGKFRRRLDLSQLELNQEIEALLNEPDLLKRSDRWRDLTEKSYPEHERKLREELRSGNINLSNLIPSLETVFHFLRIDETFLRKESAALAESKFEELQKSCGPQGFISRFLGMPMNHGAILDDAVAMLDFDELRSLIKNLLKNEVRSPLGLIQLVRLLGSEPALTYEPFQRLRSGLINKILTSGFLEHSDAFLTVLRWVENNLQIKSGFKNLSSKNRTFISWIVTHRIYCQFTEFQIEPKWVYETFSSVEVRFSTFLLSRDEVLNDVSYAKNVSAHQLVICGLFYALNGNLSLSSKQISSLNEVMRRKDSEDSMLDFSIYRELDNQTNYLSSFLNRSPLICFRDLVGEKREDTSVSPMLNEMLEGDDKKVAPWNLLEIAYGRGQVPLSLRTAFVQRVLRTQFVKLMSEHQDLGLSAFRYACWQSANVYSGELKHHLKEQAAEIVRHFAKENESSTKDGLFKAGVDAHKFLEALVKLSVHTEDSLENVRELSGLVKTLSQIDFRLLGDFRPYIEKMYWDFPLEYKVHLGPLVALVRSV